MKYEDFLIIIYFIKYIYIYIFTSKNVLTDFKFRHTMIYVLKNSYTIL